ncbi:hypothetical protein QJQ45_014017, partial [Haematococcus lacustris]
CNRATHNNVDFRRWLRAKKFTSYEAPYAPVSEPWYIGHRALLPWYDVPFKGFGFNKQMQAQQPWQMSASSSSVRLKGQRLAGRKHGLAATSGRAVTQSQEVMISQLQGGQASQLELQAQQLYLHMWELGHVCMEQSPLPNYKPVLLPSSMRLLQMLPWWTPFSSSVRSVREPPAVLPDTFDSCHSPHGTRSLDTRGSAAMAPALSLCAQEAPDEDKQWASSPHLLRPAFTLLHDTPLTHQVVGGSWCPCMDLLALVTEDGQLSIQRLDAQRLWSTQLDLHTLTSLCWQPEGKVLAAAGSDGRVTLYDVERCRVLSHWLPGPKGRPGGAAPVVSLSWVQALPLQHKSAQQQMFAMRHHRLLSWPGMALASATSQQGLDRRGSPAPGDWPPAPEALNCLVASTSRGEVAVAAFGSFQFLYLPTAAAHGPSTLPAPAEPAGSEGGAGSKARGLTWQVPALCATWLQSSAHLSRDLAFLITTACLAPDCLPDDLAAGALTCRVHWLGGLHQRHADLHLLAVLAGELQHTLEVASAAVAKAGRQWQSAQAELVKQLGVLASCLLDHQEGLQGLQGPEGEQVSEEEAVAAELACTLASGVASPGLAAFLSGRLTEAGLRRLAKMLDGSLQAVHALLQEQVQPALHCACFLLGELRGLAAPQGGAAQELRLQVVDPGGGRQGAEGRCSVAELCGAAEAEAARALLGAEALRLSCGRLGAQYRALCSWLLRTGKQGMAGLGDSPGPAGRPASSRQTPQTLSDRGAATQVCGCAVWLWAAVLVLDDEVVPEVAASLPGGLSAAGSAAASMRVDEAAVVALLEAGLHTDCLTPDLTESWVDPDLAPASLTWRQALPLEDLRPLLHLLHTPGPPSAWTAPRQLQQESSPGPPKHRVEQAGQVRGSPVQPSATCPDPAMALDPGRPPAGGSSGPAAGDWPCRPLRKQLAALQAEVELLLQGLPGRLSPGVTPLASLTILPPLPAAALQGCHSLEELHGTDSGEHGWGCSTPLAVVLPQLKAEGLPPCPDPSAAASCSVTLAVHVSAGLLRHCRQQHVSGSMSLSPPQPSPPQHTAGRAQEGVLLLELQCKAGTSGQQADQLREGQDTCFGTVTGVQARALLVLLPLGVCATDLAPYKDGQLLLLLARQAAETNPGEEGSWPSSMVMLLPAVQLCEVQDWWRWGSLLEACLAQGATNTLAAVQAGAARRVVAAGLKGVGDMHAAAAVRQSTLGLRTWSVPGCNAAAPPVPGPSLPVTHLSGCMASPADLLVGVAAARAELAAAGSKQPLLVPPLLASGTRGVVAVSSADGQMFVLDCEEDEAVLDIC